MSFKSIIKDLASIALLGITGWFLISFIGTNTYLETGYQDWLFHAAKIERLKTIGFSSWDNLYANGLNSWRAYQYLPHYLALTLHSYLLLPITQAMIYLVILSFIGLRIFIYLALRILKIKPFTAFFISLSSFTLLQQWQSIRDFSIYFSLIFLPLIILAYFKAHSNPHFFSKSLYFAFSGIAWMIHPLLGLFFAPLVLFHWFGQNLKYKIGLSLVYLFSSLPFTSQYLLKPFSVSSPFFSSASFINSTTPFEYLGTSVSFVIISFLSFFLIKKTSPAARLFYYSLAVLLLIFIGKLGFTPAFLNSLQFSRLTNHAPIATLFSAAFLISPVLSQMRTRLIGKAIITIALILILVESLTNASNFAPNSVPKPASLMTEISNDLSFGTLVYYANDSEGAYFSGGKLRFVGSYNDHLLPSPLSLRVKNLIKNIAPLPASQSQVDLLKKYLNILSVEYIILPSLSPLNKSLLTDHYFTLDKTYTSTTETLALIKITKPLNSAYLIPKSLIDLKRSPLTYTDLPDNLEALDTAVTQLDSLITSENVKQIPLSYPAPNQISLNAINLNSDSLILIPQNYDSNWHVNNPINISRHSIGFLLLTSPTTTHYSQLILTNTWPLWFYLCQIIGYATLFFCLLMVFFLSIKKLKIKN